MLPRSKPINKVRKGTRRGQPTPAEKSAIRELVYEESCGRCQLHLSTKCSGPRVLPKGGSVLERWHLVHLKAKRVHGWGRENVCGGCYACHIEEMHGKGRKPEVIR
jgi:hypothetical protein